MGLFLLGVPLAIASGIMLKKDIKYTKMNLKVDKASYSLSEQYKQIDTNFIDILRYSGAKCKIKKIGYEKYEIYDVEKGHYGGMERYLALKGFYPESISYAKRQFDKIAEKEQQLKTNKRDKQIQEYEQRIKTEQCKYYTYESSLCVYKSQKQVEKEVQQLIDYFKKHEQKDIQCNIIMGGTAPHHNHTEVWHLKLPINTNQNEVYEYYENVRNKIIGD